jgi:sigma-B regulation protein RsbU (phosphoserine phosphatase)
VLLHIREEFQADLAALLCRQAAIVILKTNLDEIASDTMLGRQLQKELLPTCFPDFAGIEASYVHQPSLGLAGDYYDFPDTGKGNLCAFLIADVSGKGIGAALYGAGAKAALSTFIRESPDPSVLLCRLNDFLCELMVRDLFLTLFIGIFEKDSGVLHYASAGHNKMILIKKTGELVYLSAEGIPLGLFPRTGYEKKTVAIDEGDILFLYTDGVTELENESLEFYGLNRLESFLLNHRNTDPDQLINSFCWSLEKFRGRRVPSDDITAVYMRFNSASDSKGFS